MRNGLIVFIVAAIVMIGAMMAYRYMHLEEVAPTTTPITAMESFVKADLGARVLVIDMDADTSPNVSDVFSGEDAILVVHNDAINSMDHDKDTIDDTGVLLATFDQNHDGRIDVLDPLF